MRRRVAVTAAILVAATALGVLAGWLLLPGPERVVQVDQTAPTDGAVPVGVVTGGPEATP